MNKCLPVFVLNSQEGNLIKIRTRSSSSWPTRHSSPMVVNPGHLLSLQLLLLLPRKPNPKILHKLLLSNAEVDVGAVEIVEPEPEVGAAVNPTVAKIVIPTITTTATATKAHKISSKISIKILPTKSHTKKVKNIRTFLQMLAGPVLSIGRKVAELPIVVIQQSVNGIIST